MDVRRRRGEGSYRVHLVSTGETAGVDEVYFEVGRYENQSMETLSSEFQSYVLAHIPRVEIQPAERLTFADRANLGFTIDWPGKQRAIMFVPGETSIFRFIRDPRSAVNDQILATVEFH